MDADPYLSVEHAIALNNRLSAATQRALAALEEKKNTRRAYEPKQREFIVWICTPPFPYVRREC